MFSKIPKTIWISKIPIPKTI